MILVDTLLRGSQSFVALSFAERVVRDERQHIVTLQAAFIFLTLRVRQIIIDEVVKLKDLVL